MHAEPTTTQLMEVMVDLKDAMLTGFTRIERRLDEHDRRFDEHDRQFEMVNRRLGRIETRVENLEQKLTA